MSDYRIEEETPLIAREKPELLAAMNARRSVRIVRQLPHAMDHPVSICHPEGEYLKGLLLQVE